MATEIRVPTLGESVSEATIGTWFKKVGDTIKADEPLVELETDKVTIEVPAPASGTLAEILAKEGETVEVNALLGQIGEAAGGTAAAAPKPQEPAREEKPAVAPSAATAAKATEAAEGRNGSSMPPAPSASKLMAENKIDAGQVEGSGKRGQVLKGDVLDAIAKGTSAPAAPAAPAAARPASSGDDAAREERVKMTRLRQTIAKRLKDAQNTAAMLTTYNEVDMSAVMDLRKKYKDIFEKKHGVKLGFMGFFTKAVTHALKELPAVNAEIDGTDIIYKNFCHIGVAVGTDKDWSSRSCATPTRCRSPRSRRKSAASASPPGTGSFRWPTCRAAPSRSRTAASTDR
jgi:2-oxoglutarate dehydrogenase E2 component (dihydrolipoamide succinyltransferase)